MTKELTRITAVQYCLPTEPTPLRTSRSRRLVLLVLGGVAAAVLTGCIAVAYANATHDPYEDCLLYTSPSPRDS